MLEHLRTALNDKAYTINRVATSVKYPASFILMASMNPCKCGNFGLYKCPNKDCFEFSPESLKVCKKCKKKMVRMCHCINREIDLYRKKLSKPLLERIDIKILITKSKTDGWDYATSSVKKKIEKARKIQQNRYKGSPYSCNGDIPRKAELFKYDKTNHETIMNKIKEKGEKNGWSWRVQDKLLLVSRTIADIEENATILNKHLELAEDIMGLNNEYFHMFE
ncbi:MAG: ATP-binding protein [Candidatus Kuenenia sp.]|nr:ATP-binding protein [Candidatus Kuenenia hertensis]